MSVLNWTWLMVWEDPTCHVRTKADLTRLLCVMRAPKKNMFWIRNRTRGSKSILCCLKQVMCRVGWLLALGSSLPPPARWQWPRTDDVCDVPRRDRKQLNSWCWLTADEPGVETPPDTLTHSANVKKKQPTYIKDQESLLDWSFTFSSLRVAK